LKKLNKLIALVSILYSFCASLGVYLRKKVQVIRTRSHGYKAASFAWHGLSQIREMSRDQTLFDPDLTLKIRSLFR